MQVSWIVKGAPVGLCRLTLSHYFFFFAHSFAQVQPDIQAVQTVVRVSPTVSSQPCSFPPTTPPAPWSMPCCHGYEARYTQPPAGCAGHARYQHYCRGNPWGGDWGELGGETEDERENEQTGDRRKFLSGRRLSLACAPPATFCPCPSTHRPPLPPPTSHLSPPSS